MSVALKINDELNGIELYFASKPEQNVLSNLKSNGFRWSKFKKCWYAKQSEKAFKIANGITNNITGEIKEITKKSPSKNIMPLWESTRWTELEGINREQETKQIAKEIRTHIRKRFPQCKFSVTSDYSSIHFYIKSSPFEKESIYLKAIYNYCDKLLNAYKYCTSYDPYGDYGSSYNFYGYVSIDYDYKQTEATEQIKKDIEDFDIKLEEANKAEEERKEIEFQKHLKEVEQRDLEYKKQQEEEKKQIQNVYNSTDIITLSENDQYFITGCEFANLNKNNTLDEYKEEVAKGDYSLKNVKVTKEIHFSNETALKQFSNMLLNDFDFLEGTGGSFTNDNKINSMTDYYNMDEDEQHTTQWNLYGVAIYFNNKLQFVIDAEGYSYARYVGLTDNAKIEKHITIEQTINDVELNKLKDQAEELETISTDVITDLNIMNTWQTDNWNEYKQTMKKQLKDYEFKLTKAIIQQIDIEPLKVAMYKLLTEVDSIQEQFKKAAIHQGEKLTLFYISDWGSMITNRITFNNATNTSYAQYNNAVKLTFTPEHKRKLHYKYFYSDLLVFKEWHNLPEKVLNSVEEKNGYKITHSKYGSCDKKQYDEILNYFDQQGIKPIVNTYKPIF